MTRTLLPVWAVYKQSLSLDAKEPVETFDWISEKDKSYRLYFVEAKRGLDSIEGSREWLKNYTFVEDSDSYPFAEPMGRRIMASLGDMHSGSSATWLGWRYKYLLNNWEKFVEETKTDFAYEDYKVKQLDDIGIANSKSMPAEEFREKYGITCDLATMATMLDALRLEKIQNSKDRQLKRDLEHFEGRVGVLKHHYKYPVRWEDTSAGSSLFGSPTGITEEMIKAVEKTYPDYREHIKGVLAARVNRLVAK
jgi:hypothetical protein